MPPSPRPEWLRIRLSTPRRYHEIKDLVDRLGLHTVCQEARCPNIYECWGEHGTATFMILGEDADVLRPLRDSVDRLLF